MNEAEPTPIVGTIQVQRVEPSGVAATVDGQPQVFPDLEALFRAALRLLDEAAEEASP